MEEKIAELRTTDDGTCYYVRRSMCAKDLMTGIVRSQVVGVLIEDLHRCKWPELAVVWELNKIGYAQKCSIGTASNLTAYQYELLNPPEQVRNVLADPVPLPAHDFVQQWVKDYWITDGARGRREQWFVRFHHAGMVHMYDYAAYRCNDP